MLRAKKINFRILGLFAFIIFSWGLAWPINKIGLQYMSPEWYTSIRLFFASFTMFCLVFVLRQFAWPKREDVPLILIIGLLQIGFYIFLASIGLSYLPAGRSSLLAYTTPLWVMPAATLFFHEEAGPLRWLGFFLGIGGLIILMSPWELNWSDKGVIFGSSALLLASLSWAISMLCARYMHWSKSPLQLIPWQLLTGALPMLLFALYHQPHMHAVWSVPLILSLFYTGFLVTGLSYWSGLIVNKELPTTIVSLGFLLVPVFSILISSLFLHEVLTKLTITAMLLIFSGLVCVVI